MTNSQATPFKPTNRFAFKHFVEQHVSDPEKLSKLKKHLDAVDPNNPKYNETVFHPAFILNNSILDGMDVNDFIRKRNKERYLDYIRSNNINVNEVLDENGIFHLTETDLDEQELQEIQDRNTRIEQSDVELDDLFIRLRMTVNHHKYDMFDFKKRKKFSDVMNYMRNSKRHKFYPISIFELEKLLGSEYTNKIIETIEVLGCSNITYRGFLLGDFTLMLHRLVAYNKTPKELDLEKEILDQYMDIFK